MTWTGAGGQPRAAATGSESASVLDDLCDERGGLAGRLVDRFGVAHDWASDMADDVLKIISQRLVN